ncbi:MAG: acyl-CoA dehydrogenase [Planctomycetota bacterium]|nr:acyl-CoA dehydrogenase [Planctomycetota bacterium]
MTPLVLSLLAVALLAAILLAYVGRPYWAWVAGGAIALATWSSQGGADSLALHVTTGLFAGAALLFGVKPLRAAILGRPLLGVLSPIFPKMSDTERIALDAGTVWWDAELFSGRPDWKRILGFKPTPLTSEEKAFLEGPCEALCGMLDDDRIRREGDLPREVWDFIARERFFGMIIPKAHGGLGFSAQAHSAVVAKLSSRSVTACVTVMVPNSLGPAELLLHYGTDEQKKHWLPRLARGEEIPCFALTEPHAGSDAGGMRSRGVVTKGIWQGREVLGLKLSWDKRYITLAPRATVVGLAFRMYDPDRLLGDRADLGITCALIPRDTPGVWIGNRHDPLGTPFLNGPTRGTDVFVPLDAIIGGPKMAGQGWRMLMECLSAGRSISLPANSVGGSQLAARYVGAYASVREQFNLSIGRFEGVEAPLARIAGTVYWMNALREVTAGAVDSGEKPAVVSAIAKAWTTEAMRRVVNDAMDVVGGAGICKGPRNVLAAAYTATPIGITVEGANILTRSMIVFGQGAIRCHPFALKEMEAAAAKDAGALDGPFFGHVGFVATNVARSFVLAATGARFAGSPVGGEAGAALRQLTRFSASFALLADAAMGTLGGTLKRKEHVTGRLADALAWMYIASAATNRYVADGQPERDRALYRWTIRESLWNVQEALRGVLDNLPARAVAIALRPVVFPLGARHRPPGDRLVAAAARALIDGNPARVALTRAMHVPGDEDPGLGRLEKALRLTLETEPLRRKLREAVKSGALPRGDESSLAAAACAKGLLSAEERTRLDAAWAARDEAIQVDDYSPADYPSTGRAAPERSSLRRTAVL